jgi:Big-like domain-containing protein
VAAVPPASGTPTGLVTFAEGGAILAQVPLEGGVASFGTALLTAGSHTITAVYGSDQTFASSGGQVAQTVRSPSSFYTVAPCRVADTRGAPGPSGGPALAANSVRNFPVAGICEIPPSATAVAINLAVFLPDDGGDLRVYAAGLPAPLASSINFRAGVARASHAIVPLGSGGQIAVQCDMPAGETHFFFDVYGYFQ